MPRPALPRRVGTSSTSKRAAAAGDDCGDAAGIGLSGSARPACLLADGTAQQLNAAAERFSRVLALHGADIGRVDEGESAGGVANPDRRRHRVDERAQRLGLARQPVVARTKLDEFALQSAYVAQPQHGAAANGPAVGFHGASSKRHERHGEALAVGPQRVHRVLQGLRFVRLEPIAERQHALRRRFVRGQIDVAANFGIVLGGTPGHQNLPLGHQEGVEAIDLGLERHDVIAQPCLGRRGAMSCPHQHDRGDDRKEQHAQRQREGRDLVAVK